MAQPDPARRRWRDGILRYTINTTAPASPHVHAHKGARFDANDDGVAGTVFYNGYPIVDAEGRGTQGALGAASVSVAGMAATGVQGRGVMVDLRHHLGDARVEVSYEMLRLPGAAGSPVTPVATG
ncbi:MAG: hypothetical protein ABI624_13490 [Casimicrobiaceae bacterium]